MLSDWPKSESTTPQGFKKYLSQILEALHITNKPLWNPDTLEALLRDLFRLVYIKEGHIISSTPSSSYYIWGDLKGAFHSLTRDLTFLQQQGVISHDLILQKDVYFIFLGNVINQSPYSVETLTAVLSLMKKNPHSVLYLSGNHEHNEFWKDHSLGQELRIKAKGQTGEHMPLSKAVTTFFSSLPRSVFIKSPDNKLIQFSYFGLASTPVQALVTGVDRSLTYQTTTGLQRLPAEKGATSWNVLSSPTLANKELYNFSRDAFALLSPANFIGQWHITLFSKDTQDNIFNKETFNLLTGQPLTKSADQIPSKEPIVFGTTLDLSKTSASLGKRLREGLELRVNKENWQGGINGHPLKIIFLDDKYTPRISKRHVLDLIATYDTNRILTPLGTPTTASFIPLIKEKKILVLFPYTGAMIFRKPDLPYIAHLRTSYANEAIALVSYAFNTIQARRYAIFYQDDTYGRAPLEGAHKAFKELGITDWLETPYVRNNPNIEDAAAKIALYNPDVVLFFSTFAPSAALIRKLGINKVASMSFMGISFLTDVFRNFLQDKGLELIMARVMPNPTVPNLEIVKNYQKDMKRFNPESILSVDSLEGYLNVDLLIHILRSIKGPLTDEAIIKQIEQIKDLEYKGLKLNFNKETRELLKDVWVDTGKGPWIKF